MPVRIVLLAAVVSLAARGEPERVAAARAHVEAPLRALFAKAYAAWPPKKLLVRAFKREKVLELWAEPKAGAAYVRIKEWPVCAGSGELGPKRHEGDGQVPEGFYRISGFNPWSSYHLSMRVDYPNASDRALGRRPLGGDIFIHGKCVTIGCIPLGDEAIEELYVAAQAAPRVDVQIFPARMTAYDELAKLFPQHAAFWKPLREAYDIFERTHRPARVRVAKDGAYQIGKAGN
jgi:murein L,D-transpeptidase YafK